MIADPLLVVAVLALLVLGVGLLRRFALQLADGTIELALRLKSPGPGRGWVHGVGRFAGDELLWYRVFSLSPRPRRRYSRSELQVLQRRDPVGGELRALPYDALIMECCVGELPVEMAMSCSAVTGFLAWMEARPPGATLPA